MDDFTDGLDLFQLDPAEVGVAAAEPETVDAPDDETSPELNEGSVGTEEDGALDPAAESVVAPAPAAQQAPPEIDWTDPRLADARQKAEAYDYAMAQVAQQQAIQSQQRIADKMAELSDGDTARYNEILTLMSEVAQPISQQAQEHQVRATNSEKLATAILLSLEAHLPADQQSTIKNTIQELMRVEGPETMQKIAFAELENAKKYAPVIAAKDQKIAELEKRLEASARVSGRQGRGANRVDTGTSTPVGANANTMDDFFDEIFAGTKFRS